MHLGTHYDDQNYNDCVDNITIWGPGPDDEPVELEHPDDPDNTAGIKSDLASELTIPPTDETHWIAEPPKPIPTLYMEAA